MDFVVPMRELRGVSISPHHHKGLLIYDTFAYPQRVVSLGNERVDNDAYKDTRKSVHYNRRSQLLVYEQSYNLTTITVNSFGCLGKTASEFVDQLTTSSVAVMEDTKIYGETLL